MDGADVDQPANAVFPAALQHIFRAVHIDPVNPVARMRGDRDKPRAVNDAGVFVRARKKTLERGFIAHIPRYNANVLRKLPRQRIAVHHQGPDLRLRVPQLRKHGAPQESRRSRNQILRKHPITSKKRKTNVDYLSHLQYNGDRRAGQPSMHRRVKENRHIWRDCRQ